MLLENFAPPRRGGLAQTRLPLTYPQTVLSLDLIETESRFWSDQGLLLGAHIGRSDLFKNHAFTGSHSVQGLNCRQSA